jgi:hypothetical protein
MACWLRTRHFIFLMDEHLALLIKLSWGQEMHHRVSQPLKKALSSTEIMRLLIVPFQSCTVPLFRAGLNFPASSVTYLLVWPFEQSPSVARAASLLSSRNPAHPLARQAWASQPQPAGD